MNAEKPQAVLNPTKQRSYTPALKSVVVILVLGTVASFLVHTVRHLSPSNALLSSRSHIADLPLYWTDVDIPVSAEASAQRAVYPYSVIPGGVVSSKELTAALHRDSVAAAHYSDFRASSARIMRLPKTRQVYVSYRLGDRVFWTSKRVTLAAGETILTDGSHLARTRCGNRISEVPGPTSPAEPPLQAMNKPVFRNPADGPSDTAPAAPLWSDRAAPSLMALSGPVSSLPGGHAPFVPPIPIGPCCSAPGGPSGSNTPPPGPPSEPPSGPPSGPPQPPTSPGPPPVATPEPETLLLLVAGLAALFIASSLRRS